MAVFSCPHCATTLNAAISAGKSVSCPKCKNVFPVPSSLPSAVPLLPSPQATKFLFGHTSESLAIIRGIVWAVCFLFVLGGLVTAKSDIARDDSAVRQAAIAGKACLELIGYYVIARALSEITYSIQKK